MGGYFSPPPPYKKGFFKMVKFEDDVNVNIYNLYHKRMLNKRTPYVYVFFSNECNPYEIKQIEFKEIEEYYDNFKERIYTIETKLDKAIEYADKIILNQLYDETKNLTDKYNTALILNFELYRSNTKQLSFVEYFYDCDNKGEYQRTGMYREIKRAEK